MDDIEAIAKRLTDAQRRTLIEGSSSRLIARNWPNRHKMISLGLAVPLYGNFGLQPTEVGLAVKSHLEGAKA